MKKANSFIFATIACALGISLIHNRRLAVMLSRMENAVHMIDEKLRAVNSGTNVFARTAKTDYTIEIERNALYAAYQVEKADFDSSHKMMGGDRISYAMLCNAERDFQSRWKSIVTNWFYSTARNDYERKWMKEYDVGVYGETDSSRSTWFLRFKDGALIDTCDLGNEYWDEDRQLFCFEPRGNRLEILSVSDGKRVKELFLALWDYGKYPDGSHYFGTNKEPITDSAHDCAKLSGVHFE